MKTLEPKNNPIMTTNVHYELTVSNTSLHTKCIIETKIPSPEMQLEMFLKYILAFI